MGAAGARRPDRGPGTPGTLMVGIIILCVLTVMFLISASTGLDKGIKILSDLNMAMAVFVMLFVIFAVRRAA